MTGVILFCSFLLIFSSCNKEKNIATSGENRKIAKVFDREIYDSEIRDLINNDSLEITKAYIDKVVQEEALLKKANETENLDHKDIEAKVTNFRNSLLILKYQDHYFSQFKDTLIPDSAIKYYYTKNAPAFHLTEDIFKGFFIQIPSGTPKTERLKSLMQSDRPSDIQEIKSFCLRYAKTFSMNFDSWKVFPKTIETKKLITSDNSHTLVSSKQVLSYEKEENIYLIRLIDYRTSRQVSPLDYCKTEIRNIILNKRKMQAWEKLKEQLLLEATKNHQVEIYN